MVVAYAWLALVKSGQDGLPVWAHGLIAMMVDFRR